MIMTHDPPPTITTFKVLFSGVDDTIQWKALVLDSRHEKKKKRITCSTVAFTHTLLGWMGFSLHYTLFRFCGYVPLFLFSLITHLPSISFYFYLDYLWFSTQCDT